LVFLRAGYFPELSSIYRSGTYGENASIVWPSSSAPQLSLVLSVVSLRGVSHIWMEWGTIEAGDGSSFW
jgi:hypothetical protein